MIIDFVRARKSGNAKEASDLTRIKDAAACRQWLARLTPHDTNASLQSMAFFLHELVNGPSHASLRAEHKFSILEEIRAPILRLLEERLQDVEARTSPPSIEEAGTLWDLIDATTRLRDAYTELVGRLIASPEDAAGKALHSCTNIDALHRAITLSAELLLLVLHARIRVPVSLWEQHCVLGKLVRQLHCQDETVKDPHTLEPPSPHTKMEWTCREAFITPILFALGDPSSLGRGESLMLRLAAQHWAKKVGFRIDAPSARLLSHHATQNPGPVIELAGYLVRFDTQRLLKKLDRLVTDIDTERKPKDWPAISADTNISLGAARGFIEDLEHYWGAVEPETIDTPGQAWRKPTTGFALAVVGMQAMNSNKKRGSSQAGSGRSVYQTHRLPEESPTRSREEIQREWIDSLLDSAETWNLMGETTDMLLCTRRLQLPRIYLHQLVVMKQGSKKSKEPYHLGWIVGLQQATNGVGTSAPVSPQQPHITSDLGQENLKLQDKPQAIRPSATQVLRVHLFPGRARSIRVALEDGVMLDSYLLLPLDFTEMQGDTLLDLLEEGAALDEQIQSQPERFSLLMPVASWRPGRQIRIVVHGVPLNLGMKELLFRGLDFDYVTLRRSA